MNHSLLYREPKERVYIGCARICYFHLIMVLFVRHLLQSFMMALQLTTQRTPLSLALIAQMACATTVAHDIYARARHNGLY